LYILLLHYWQGENVIGTWLVEEALATYSHYVGQPYAVVVADTQRQADYAANKVQATYEQDDGAPIVSNMDAIARDSFFEKMQRHHTRGDFAEGIKRAEHTLTGNSLVVCLRQHDSARCMLAGWLLASVGS
jgi:xanthine dehydrogenase molybdopterin-binding subunit B